MKPENVEKALGSPVSRKIFKIITEKRDDGTSLYEDIVKYLKGEQLPLLRKMKILPLVPFLKPAIQIATANDPSKILEILNNEPYTVHAIETVLESVAKYELRKPQIFSAPLLIVWNLTNVCNLRCEHCYQRAAHPLPDELSLEEKIQAIDKIWDAGTSLIAFSGGEPLMAPEAFKIFKYAHDKGFHVSIATNGTLLTPANIEKLIEAGVNYIEVSLDSIHPDIHDAFRGVNGAWKRTTEGIKNAVKLGKGVFTVGLATTVTHINFSEFEDIIKFAFEELGVDKFFAFNFIPVGRGRDMATYDLSPEEREKMMSIMYKYLSKGYNVFTTAPQFGRVCKMGTSNIYVSSHYTAFEGEAGSLAAEYIGGCGVGRAYAAIQPNGDLSPCVFMPQEELKFGNIIKDDLKDVWENSPVLKAVRNRDEFEANCGKCPYRYVCGGCRARAYAYFKNLKAPDPGCLLNKTAWNRIREAFVLESA